MGNKSSSYENDPYLTNQEYKDSIKGYYQNNSSLYNVSLENKSKEENIKYLFDNQKQLKTKSFSNSFLVKNGKIKLEKDAIENNRFYITFEYISYKPIKAQLFFNVHIDHSKTILTSEYSSNSVFIEKTAPDYSLFINKDFQITKEQILDLTSTQSKIQVVLRIDDDDDDNSSILCFKFMNVDGFLTLKLTMHKIIIDMNWFDVHDVYGLAGINKNTDESLCQICMSNMKNTIFIPCMHSNTCSECAIKVRINDGKCPICRREVSDTMKLNVDN